MNRVLCSRFPMSLNFNSLQGPFLIQSSSHAPFDFVSSILPIRRNKIPYTAHWFLFRRPKTLQKYVEIVFFPGTTSRTSHVCG
ncbi:hypothetical protein ES332_D11G063900v1 [Gossypium tomentosum]|uniref:Uncharacterized protein n=1 Tax=Gossypium tomentosum TaxID=34277 RepID=A0A5D2IJT5_GOSTO|nr:hypothetical protein ES332_D11G063900v1 [Gossypium tomentosum]